MRRRLRLGDAQRRCKSGGAPASCLEGGARPALRRAALREAHGGTPTSSHNGGRSFHKTGYYMVTKLLNFGAIDEHLHDGKASNFTMEDVARPSKKARRRRGRAAGSGLMPFALRLVKQFSESEGDGGSGNNLVFSPLSIYAALALVAAGAEGETLDEFLSLLGVASRDELAELVRGMTENTLAGGSGSGGPVVSLACGVWYQGTVALKPAYRAAAVESYKAETRAASFVKKAEKVRKEINKWVSKATNKLITSILGEGSVNSKTVLVLANAIYFKGTWSKRFLENNTRDETFYCLDGSCVRAPFMHSTEDQFIEQHEGFKVLKLPYRNSASSWEDDDCDYYQQSNERPRFSMCIFLPDAQDGLPALIDKMASSSSFQLRDYLPKRCVNVGKFYLPKFKLSFSSRMNETLKAMGLEAVFSKDEANLSNMVEDSNGLYMDHVFHKAVIEVNEDGTEAAASTACILKKVADFLSSITMDFIADHPFVFFIVEEVSGSVVFMGQVLDPTRSE